MKRLAPSIGTTDSAPDMAALREQFVQLSKEVRPELHRYCARMTGSVFDGEDIVQETFIKAHGALSEMSEPVALKPWLFRIAHNAAMDFHKRYERKHIDLVAELPEPADQDEPDVDPALVQAALGVFLGLPPLQRSALILKDVLGHSLDQVASALEISLGATKAALSRARANINRITSGTHAVHAASSHTAARAAAPTQSNLQRYVDLFNAHDWDGLRNLLSAEAELDLVSRLQKRVVDAGYYHRYSQILQTEAWRAECGTVDGVPVVAMFRPAEQTPTYFVVVSWHNDQVTNIRDFYYASYVTDGVHFTPMTRP